MARRNQGPRLRYLEQRGAFYVTWTVNGRSHKCSTGTADSEQAQEFFAEWLVSHGERKAIGPRDPSQVLISEILNDYLLEAKPSAVARAAYAVPPLMDFFGEGTVDKVTKQTCKRYGQTRGLWAPSGANWASLEPPSMSLSGKAGSPARSLWSYLSGHQRAIGG